MKAPFTLTLSDKQSPLWGKLKAHLEERRQELHLKNEGPKPESETATIRGQLSELKRLLALNQEKPVIEP